MAKKTTARTGNVWKDGNRVVESYWHSKRIRKTTEIKVGARTLCGFCGDWNRCVGVGVVRRTMCGVFLSFEGRNARKDLNRRGLIWVISESRVPHRFLLSACDSLFRQIVVHTKFEFAASYALCYCVTSEHSPIG